MSWYAILLILFYCSCHLSISLANSITSTRTISLSSLSTANKTNSTTITTNSNMNYHAVLRKLYQINTKNPVKMGLSNTIALYNLIGRPLDSIPIIHIAGTNGKGSVALKTANCLQKSGIKTGETLYMMRNNISNNNHNCKL